MERLRLAFAWLCCCACFVATGGCMKAGPPAGIPTVVVAVAPVLDGPGISILGPAAASHPADDSDGFTTGDRVEIDWQGSWLPATLVERRGDRWLVRYDAGDGDSREYGEETVERERIRVAVALPDDEVGEVDVDP